MKKEISKGTQKFIWHMAAFVAVFVLALVAIIKFAPSPTPTPVQSSPQQSVSTQENLPQGSDFESVKERVDAANNSTGKEVQSLYKVNATYPHYHIKRTSGSWEKGVKHLDYTPREYTVKYRFECVRCGATFERKKESKLVKHPEKFRCGNCGARIRQI